MSKPHSLKAYSKAVLAASEVNRQVNFDETFSLPGGEFHPPKVYLEINRKAAAKIVRQAVLLDVDSKKALIEFQNDFEEI